MKGATLMSLYEIIPNKNLLTVSPLLIKLGIPLSLSGHRYLCSAVNIYSSLMQNNSRIKITQDIYPEVAYQYGTTSQCVERSIRHAVGICFTRGDLKLIDKMFGFTINEAKGKPTNGEFIATISYWLTGEATSAVASM